jgi:cystathionine beta-lyase/cystathionine gamma-synthase
LLKSGDGIISASSLSGATENFLNRIVKPTYGMEVTFVDMTDLSEFESSIKSNTKMVMIEFPTNPVSVVFSMPEISKICQKYGLLFVVDNTMNSPYNVNPLDFGADIIWHSCSKYISGFSDIVMGCLITNSSDLHQKLKEIYDLIYPAPSPFDCWQVLISVKTLALRMQKIGQNALKLSKFLQTHQKIGDVFYTGLEEHPGHELFKDQSRGNSGIVSFVIKNASQEMIRNFMKKLNIIKIAVSLGGAGSTAEFPAMMSHKRFTSEERAKAGIDEALVRVAVGLEDVEDLIRDVGDALDSME